MNLLTKNEQNKQIKSEDTRENTFHAYTHWQNLIFYEMHGTLYVSILSFVAHWMWMHPLKKGVQLACSQMEFC